MNIFITTGAVFGALGIILGAFGAHALKKIFSEEQLKNYETGVKYQMYHALLLIVAGLHPDTFSRYFQALYYCLTFGIILFSFSIYGLCISGALNKKMRFLGPVTPVGGILLLCAWILIIFNSLN